VDDNEEQAVYEPENPVGRGFSVTRQRRDFAAEFTVPEGAWRVYVSLKSAAGSVEFDNVRLTAD